MYLPHLIASHRDCFSLRNWSPDYTSKLFWLEIHLTKQKWLHLVMVLYLIIPFLHKMWFFLSFFFTLSSMLNYKLFSFLPLYDLTPTSFYRHGTYLCIKAKGWRWKVNRIERVIFRMMRACGRYLCCICTSYFLESHKNLNMNKIEKKINIPI